MALDFQLSCTSRSIAKQVLEEQAVYFDRWTVENCAFEEVL
jgi:hypothetical protein